MSAHKVCKNGFLAITENAWMFNEEKKKKICGKILNSLYILQINIQILA